MCHVEFTHRRVEQMIFNAKQCHQPSFSSTYAMKMCQQMLFFSMIKNLSKPVDLNQFFFFCRVCPKCKRIASLTALSFSFSCVAFADDCETAGRSNAQWFWSHHRSQHTQSFHLHQPPHSLQQQRSLYLCSRNKNENKLCIF